MNNTSLFITIIELQLNITDQRQEDMDESRKITRFLTKGCKCRLGCYKYFPRSHYELIRNQCSELSREALDMVVMGQLLALTPTGKERCRLLMHQGKQV